MRARLAAAMLLGAAACSHHADPIEVPVPGRMRFALSSVTDLSASAQLVQSGGTRMPETKLLRASDGVSFSGFIAAAPGNYTLEVTFSGVVASGDRVFLGRAISDGFTVASGHTAEAKFTAPLDVLGRPEDHSDDDHDGLGMLDEILFGTDPKNPDTDGDKLLDGVDCDPKDPMSRYHILAGGSLEDCDADGYRRIDIPFGMAGDDCNDKDPNVHPGGPMMCINGVPGDCSPGTCPTGQDTTPPVIGDVTPADGSAVGCHTFVSAHITDDTSVAYATATLDEGLAMGPLTFSMMKDPMQADTFKTMFSFNALAGERTNGLITGPRKLQIHAQDPAGNMAMKEVTYNFTLDFPMVTNMTPPSIGIAGAPFMVTVDATANLGLKSITLMAAMRSSSGVYAGDTATVLGTSTQSPASFMVDPSALMNGQYVLYPVVRDQVGNAAEPYPNSLTPFAMNGTVVVTADYTCMGAAMQRYIPARTMIVGPSNYAPSSMRDHLAEALMLASMKDPNAHLVSIIAFGIQADGKVALDDASSYTKRWTYGFRNDSTMDGLSVSWYTQAYSTMMNPVVKEPDGSITSSEPFGDTSMIADSDAVVAAFAASPNCGAVSGNDNDFILYQTISGQQTVYVSTKAGKTWRGTSVPPIMTTIQCQ